MKLSIQMAFPLVWPVGRGRTALSRRKKARFEVPFGIAVDHLLEEIRRMGSVTAVISTNVRGYEQRGVWRPYSLKSEPDDTGVACYFGVEDDPICLSCDRWLRVVDNIRAVGLTIAAMRSLERWGAAERRQAFQGFRALPASHHDWRTVLGLSGKPDYQEVRKQYRRLAASAHPDQGGSEHDMARLNLALEAAKGELDAQ